MPITAKSKVINAALAHLGEPGYDDIEVAPAPPKLAKALAQIEFVQDWVLRRHPWVCTLVYASIERANRAGNWKYPYVFELPATALRVWEIADSIKWVRGSETVGLAEKIVIWTDSAWPLDLSYVDRKTWESYDADVTNVMAYELASRLAGPIQDDAMLAARLHKSALEMLALAQGADGTEEGGQDPIFPSGFAQLRRAGSF